MHRRTGVDLLPLDIDLERTIRNLKKVIVAVEAPIMVEQRETNQNIPGVAVDRL